MRRSTNSTIAVLAPLLACMTLLACMGCTDEAANPQSDDDLMTTLDAGPGPSPSTTDAGIAEWDGGAGLDPGTEDGDDAGIAPSDDSLPYGGMIFAAYNEADGFIFRAGPTVELYSETDHPDGLARDHMDFYGPIAEDACEALPYADEDPEDDVPVTPLDVGPEVFLTGEAGRIVLTRDLEDGRLTYQGGGFVPFPDDMAPGAVYTLEIAGTDDVEAATIPMALAMPASRDVVFPSSPLDPSAPFVVTWTPGSGERMEIQVTNPDFSAGCDCDVVDDGSFTVPADCLAAVTDPVRVIVNVTRAVPSVIHGREVAGIGVHGLEARVTREL